MEKSATAVKADPLEGVRVIMSDNNLLAKEKIRIIRKLFGEYVSYALFAIKYSGLGGETVFSLLNNISARRIRGSEDMLLDILFEHATMLPGAGMSRKQRFIIISKKMKGDREVFSRAINLCNFSVSQKEKLQKIHDSLS